MPGGDACAMVQAIRHNQLGSNPFVPIIFTTWEADADVVRRVVDRGADDPLIKPLSTEISEERSVGKECCRTCSSRWSTDHSNKKQTPITHHIYTNSI